MMDEQDSDKFLSDMFLSDMVPVGQRSSRSRCVMSQHVHVRLNRGLAVSEDGELVEQSYCRCGATWTRTFQAAEDEPER